MNIQMERPYVASNPKMFTGQLFTELLTCSDKTLQVSSPVARKNIV